MEACSKAVCPAILASPILVLLVVFPACQAPLVVPFQVCLVLPERCQPSPALLPLVVCQPFQALLANNPWADALS